MITNKTLLNNRDEINSALQEIGFKGVSFGPELDKKYQDYLWILVPYGDKKLRLCALPRLAEIGRLPWETWYIPKGKPIHHVHSAIPYKGWERWIVNEFSSERPDHLVAEPWYWYEEPDMTPYLLMDKEPEAV